MYTIYGIKNCSTMKKAMTALDEQGINYDFFDYKKQDISAETIASWVEELGIAVVLNKRGTTWRKQPDNLKAEADADINKAIQLMAENSSMIKRPILVNKDKNLVIAGFNAEEYAQLEHN